MDSASSELFVEATKRYDLNFKSAEKSKSVPHASSADLNKMFESYASKYPFASIEDPFDQDDWHGWIAMTAGLGKKTQIVGDDLLVTLVRLRWPILVEFQKLMQEKPAMLFYLRWIKLELLPSPSRLQTWQSPMIGELWYHTDQARLKTLSLQTWL